MSFCCVDEAVIDVDGPCVDEDDADVDGCVISRAGMSKFIKDGTSVIAKCESKVHGRIYTEHILARLSFDMRFPGKGHHCGQGTIGLVRFT